MKKIIYIISILAFFSSCNLDENPASLAEEHLNDSPDGAQLYVTGIYNTFWSSYMMKKTYMEWVDMDHDHASAESWVVSGAGMGNVTTHWGYNHTDSDLFNAFFLIVNRANMALKNIDSNIYISQEDKDQLKGESYFLRAYAYFHLVRMYGPVPLRLEFRTPRDVVRSSEEQVYTQIVIDLENAIKLMHIEGMDSSRWGLASKTAAKLLLAKVYANMGSGAVSQSAKMKVDIKGVVETFDTDAVAGCQDIDARTCYTRVKELCDDIIAARGIHFDLRSNYLSLWGEPNKRNNEFIWGITGHNDFRTEHLNYYYTPYPYGGRGWAGISCHLYRMYEEQDHRAVYGVFHYMKRAIDSPQYDRFPNDATKYGTSPDGKPTRYSNFSDLVFPTKWYLGDIANPSASSDVPTYQAQDVPLLRFAEAYLLRAEALNELDQPALALADVDVIRARSNASLLVGTTSDKVDVRSIILAERAMEFAQEFNRKFDLLRWGLYLKVMNKTVNVPTKYGSTISKIREPRSVLYAVPTTEINGNKLFGPNNPGW